MPKKYRIGTRGSLLALTQAEQTKQQLEKLTGDEFELIPIKTQGDLNTSVPLWQLEGQNFFTKELDQALLNKDVDLVIHSYKDLGSVRPEGLVLAATTKRSFAQDILLIRRDRIPQIKTKTEFLVGTSSPRRISNITCHLENFLPKKSNNLTITTAPLRGNVNTRVKKLVDGEYDAIILALAGLERLSQSLESRLEMMKMIPELTFMLLPQSVFPSAASQGALAIELLDSRDDDGELLEKMSRIQDDKSFQEVKRERKAFNEYGGGCHLAVGINVKKIGDQFFHIHEGEINENRISHRILESDNSSIDDKIKTCDSLFIGLPQEKLPAIFKDDSIYFDQLIKKSPILDNNLKKEPSNIFVASNYCIPQFENIFKEGTLWASGTKTMKELVKKGYWVHGTSDSMGEVELMAILESTFLKLMEPNLEKIGWKILTNETSDYSLGEVVSSYKRELVSTDEMFNNGIKKVRCFYWASYFQYKEYVQKYPEIESANHFCGLGKTLQNFQKAGIKVRPQSSIEDMKKFLK